MTDLHVRVLTPDDQTVWRALRLESLETHPKAFLTTAAEQRARSAQEDRVRLSYGNWRGLFDADQLIGLAALIPMQREKTQHRMQIGALYVVPALRGTGAAQTLMESLEAEAKSRGARQLELEVSTANATAISFYERLGFEQTGRKPRAVWTSGGPQDDLLYVKFLDGGSC